MLISAVVDELCVSKASLSFVPNFISHNSNIWRYRYGRDRVWREQLPGFSACVFDSMYTSRSPRVGRNARKRKLVLSIPPVTNRQSKHRNPLLCPGTAKAVIQHMLIKYKMFATTHDSLQQWIYFWVCCCFFFDFAFFFSIRSTRVFSKLMTLTIYFSNVNEILLKRTLYIR